MVTYLTDKLLHRLALQQIVQLVFAEVFLLFAFVAVVVVLGSPKFAPQRLDGVELQVQNGVQKCLAVLAINGAQRIDVLQRDVVGHIVDHIDGRKQRDGSVAVAQVLRARLVRFGLRGGLARAAIAAGRCGRMRRVARMRLATGRRLWLIVGGR